MSHPASQDPGSLHHPQSHPSLGDPRLNTEQFLARDENFNRSQLTSICIHGALAALLLLPLFIRVALPPSVPPPGAIEIYTPEISTYVPHISHQLDTGTGGGSGGGHDTLPVTKGTPPSKFGPVQIVPPTISQNKNATLQVEPILLAPKEFEIPQEFAPNWGDPSAKDFNNSRGRGVCCGMGDNGGNGIGNGPPGTSGYGPGGGDGIRTPGRNGVTYPACAYCPRPEYSDEARRAKYQGTVILNVVVLPDGRASAIEVINSPGLGLEEKAKEAVSTWRFTPAHDTAGKPVAARINVEVVFQLF